MSTSVDPIVNVGGNSIDVRRITNILPNKDAGGRVISYTIVKDGFHDDKDASDNDIQGGHAGNRDTFTAEEAKTLVDRWNAYNGRTVASGTASAEEPDAK